MGAVASPWWRELGQRQFIKGASTHQLQSWLCAPAHCKFTSEPLLVTCCCLRFTDRTWLDMDNEGQTVVIYIKSFTFESFSGSESSGILKCQQAPTKVKADTQCCVKYLTVIFAVLILLMFRKPVPHSASWTLCTRISARPWPWTSSWTKSWKGSWKGPRTWAQAQTGSQACPLSQEREGLSRGKTDENKINNVTQLTCKHQLERHFSVYYCFTLGKTCTRNVL